MIAVAMIMAGLAAVVMAALFSMKKERNLFAEGADKLMKKTGAEAVVQQGAKAVQPAGAALRRCVIDGKTVFSDTECKASNPTSKAVVVHETRGIEAPKVPKPDPAASGPESIREKMIEKATQ
ncbi:hypothetical protein GCM10027277_18110 [Pseudoduganella ginsengisoli]